MKPGIYLTAEEILGLKTDLLPIKKLLDKIQDNNVKIFTAEGLKKAPNQFWTDPCSIKMSKDIPNRTFHNPITLVNPGGIINHKIYAAHLALDALRRRNCLQDCSWQDRALSATLLHDVCKNGLPWGEKMHPRHGELALEFLKYLPSFKQLGFENKHQILRGIQFHMGHWGPLPPNRPFTEFEQVIQEADYYSTRFYLTGVDIQLINYPPKTRV